MNKETKKYLDLEKVLKNKAPGASRFIPRFIVRRLERLICQDRINEIWDKHQGKEGAELCEAIMSELNVSLEVINKENLPDPSDRKVLFVSNHPLGGFDGVAIIDMLHRHYGVEPLFIVNDLLMFLTPLQRVFVPINKHGAQSRASVEAIDEAFRSDRPVIIFPAGLVSRRGKNGVVADLKWQKSFVQKAKRFGRDIIPLYFDGENSPFFYKFAKFRKRIGLKFNVEMIYLPREMFRCENKTFSIIVGDRIPHSTLASKNLEDAALDIRKTVYALPKQAQDWNKE